MLPFIVWISFLWPITRPAPPSGAFLCRRVWHPCQRGMAVACDHPESAKAYPGGQNRALLSGITDGNGVPRHCGLLPSIWVPAGTHSEIPLAVAPTAQSRVKRNITARSSADVPPALLNGILALIGFAGEADVGSPATLSRGRLLTLFCCRAPRDLSHR